MPTYDDRYEPGFLIRGVSLDTHRGIVMKLTFLHTITPSEPLIARRGDRSAPPLDGDSLAGECGVADGAARGSPSHGGSRY